MNAYVLFCILHVFFSLFSFIKLRNGELKRSSGKFSSSSQIKQGNYQTSLCDNILTLPKKKLLFDWNLRAIA